MKIYSAGPSPYGRKVKMTAKMKGLFDQISFEDADTMPVDNPELQAKNPLSKIPVLITDAGTAIYDSHVICEYLDGQVAHPVLFPGEGEERWTMLTRASLADGILDAALLLVYEKRFRPEEKWHDDWMRRQQLKIEGGVAYLEANIPHVERNPDYGHLSIAAALGYLDFRHEGRWRDGHPKLVAWLDDFAKSVPAFDATRPA